MKNILEFELSHVSIDDLVFSSIKEEKGKEEGTLTEGMQIVETPMGQDRKSVV